MNQYDFYVVELSELYAAFRTWLSEHRKNIFSMCDCLSLIYLFPPSSLSYCLLLVGDFTLVARCKLLLHFFHLFRMLYVFSLTTLLTLVFGDLFSMNKV